MAYNTINFRVADSEDNSPEATIPIYMPTGLTVVQYQAIANVFAGQLDLLTAGVITGASINLALTLPGGLKASVAEAGCINERGGLITFDTSGPRADSVRIPAMRRSLMPGDSFSLSDVAVAAFIGSLITGAGPDETVARTSQDYVFTAARRAAKSMRK